MGQNLHNKYSENEILGQLNSLHQIFDYFGWVGPSKEIMQARKEVIELLDEQNKTN